MGFWKFHCRRSPQLERESADQLVRRSLAGSLAIPLALSACYVATSLDERTPLLINSLTLGSLLLVLVRLLACHFLAAGRGDSHLWSRCFFVSIGLTGLLWGVIVEAVRQSVGSEDSDFRMMLLALFCLAFGAALSYFSHLALFQTYLAGITLPLFAGSLWEHSAASLPITFAVGLLALFLFVQSRRLSSEYWQAKENAELLAKRALELEEANERAEAAARSRSAFLACMSHEIRTPINGVLGMLALVLDSRLTDDQRDGLLTAKESAESLLRIINDILDFSKIEAGRLELLPEPFSLPELLTSIDKSFAPMMQMRGLEWRVEYPELPAVYGDPVRLRQILVNLIGNAMRFTDAGHVRLVLKAKPPAENTVTLHFAVEDTGIGIPPDKLEAIFSPFVQADSSNQRRAGGTGLGLSISRRLATLMDGRVWAESTMGEGSTFHLLLNLPLAAGPAPVRRAVPEVRLEGIRVLVVEDNPVNEKVFSSLLRRRGAEVRIARDGYEAVGQVIDHEFDLILMDVQMPRMDGLEAASAIRAREAGTGRRTPIIAMTAAAMNEDRERCLQAGMDAYLSKPVLPETFFETIATVLSNSGLTISADPSAAPTAP